MVKKGCTDQLQGHTDYARRAWDHDRNKTRLMRILNWQSCFPYRAMSGSQVGSFLYYKPSRRYNEAWATVWRSRTRTILVLPKKYFLCTCPAPFRTPAQKGLHRSHLSREIFCGERDFFRVSCAVDADALSMFWIDGTEQCRPAQERGKWRAAICHGLRAIRVFSLKKVKKPY